MNPTFEISESSQLQVKQHMLLALDCLTENLYDDDDYAVHEKIHTLCEGYDMMLRLMDELKERKEER